MSAVDNLLGRLDALDRAVTALSEGSISDQAIADHLARGIAVNGLVAVESFLRERMQEWTAALSSARIPALSLPGGTRQYENRVIEVLPRRLRDEEFAESVQRSNLLVEIGKSLTSLYAGTLVPHRFAFMWAGANVQEADIEAMVSLVLPDKGDNAWKILTGIWSAVDKYFPGNTSLRNVFDQICKLRHAAAHQDTPSLPALNLRSTTRNVKLVCLCIDVAVSLGLRNLHPGPVKGARSGTSKVAVRRLAKKGSKWREFSPSRKRATKVHTSLDDAMAEAVARSRPAGEVVLVVDEQDNILDWRLTVA